MAEPIEVESTNGQRTLGSLEDCACAEQALSSIRGLKHMVTLESNYAVHILSCKVGLPPAALTAWPGPVITWLAGICRIIPASRPLAPLLGEIGSPLGILMGRCEAHSGPWPRLKIFHLNRLVCGGFRCLPRLTMRPTFLQDVLHAIFLRRSGSIQPPPLKSRSSRIARA
jgi:hypothetical protein